MGPAATSGGTEKEDSHPDLHSANGDSDSAFRTRLQSFEYAGETDSLPERHTVDMAPKQVVSRNLRASSRRAKSSSPAPHVLNGKVGKSSAKQEAIFKRDPAKGDTPLKTGRKIQRRRVPGRKAPTPRNFPNKLVDSLRPGLTLVMIGLNPGHAYSHRTNHFWPLMHDSGITPVKHLPSETHELMDLYGIGHTNICARPSRTGSELSKAELAEGAGILEAKIRDLRPEAVAIVGKSIWEALWLARTGNKQQKSEFKYGWQDEEAQLGRIVDSQGRVEWEGAKTYVTCTTSALFAHMKYPEKQAIWKPLGDWFSARRAQRSAETESSD